MSYVLNGFGKHQYQAPIVTQGLGIRYINLPGGIVLGWVESGFILAEAGRYPVLGRVTCWIGNFGLRTYGIASRVWQQVYGMVRGWIDEL